MKPFYLLALLLTGAGQISARAQDSGARNAQDSATRDITRTVIATEAAYPGGDPAWQTENGKPVNSIKNSPSNLS
jgi:hypothetical protein